jgi:predicted patatin/cPLA2 family phospholipase
MKKGLVLEGGAMRGLFTAGICDVMMEHNVWPDGLIGVSAGAAFGCNYKSRQPGRAIRYNMRFARDSRYSGTKSLLSTGNYFNADFAYHIVPQTYDKFDDEAFQNNPMEFYVVCTDVSNGKAVYKKLENADADSYDWIRASASMPLVSRCVELEGYKLLDGGVTDSIPLERFEQLGYQRNVVILTQPDGYLKQRSHLMPFIKIALRKHPAMIKAMAKRPEIYNAELEYVRNAEREGRCLVIRPEKKIPIGHVSHNPDQMKLVYDMGRKAGEDRIAAIKDFYAQ